MNVTVTVFDLAKMKRLFGEPILLGGEKMRDFDDHANSLINDFEVGNAMMAALVYNFILESFKRMRLMRHQSRAMQARILQDRSTTSPTDRQDRETEVTAAMSAKINLYPQFDYLISEATKREALLLQQISIQSALLADKLYRQLENERARIEFAQSKSLLRRQKAIDTSTNAKSRSRHPKLPLKRRKTAHDQNEQTRRPTIRRGGVCWRGVVRPGSHEAPIRHSSAVRQRQHGRL